VLWTSLESVAEGIYRRVCPLYGVDHRDHLHVVGSAIPFDSRGFRFLLSAAHVCLEDDGSPRPLFTMGAEKEWPLVGRRGSWEYKPTRMPDIDIAVIGLDDACADDLQQYYQFTTPADVATLEPRTPLTHFFVAGYAATRNRFRSVGHGLPSRATFLVARDLVDLSNLQAADKTDEQHFALSVPTMPIRKLGGGMFHLPKPHGMSGGGVWRFEVDDRSRLISTPRLIGVSIEHHKRENAFLATRVQMAIPLAHDLFDLVRQDRTVSET